uniref:Saposin B-type domain-containing protein n=1 Tax=Meloidogyne hapla TaxID=6305 RepID=A0A1I8AZP5_MELHA
MAVLSDNTICSTATGFCRDNTRFNELLKQNKLACTLCQEGLMIVKEIIIALVDSLSILKFGCANRKICLRQFRIVEDLNNFVQDMSEEGDIELVCREILLCVE